ncbi:MAG: zincin-like metallopeptidase domain-containing protein [Photobacterium frigidiphilum]|uniref:ArdC family protein n=1 Tax=Photobacterium frigidiphilum TaxID=264736 RepID=UPI00300274D2
MTHSTAINSTITKQHQATSVSPLEQSGSNKNVSSKRKPRRVTKVAKDMYQIVTDRIIQSLEKGVKPWVCPWDRTQECTQLPMNFKTKHQYSGVNILLLWSEIVEKGYSSPYWLTYKQAVELGGNVIKGQKGTAIIFYKMLEKDNDQGEKNMIPMLKSFTVFNLDQIENIEKPSVSVSEARKVQGDFVTLDHVEAAMVETGATISHLGVRAFYSPSHDVITLPTKDRFASSSDYYATAMHELTHWSGYKSRLDRDLKNSFGSKDYAFEELVAELGAAFCCADLSVFGKVQHEDYIAGWLKKLNDDKRFIFKAASLASKAHAFLINE